MRGIIFGCGNKGKQVLPILRNVFHVDILAFADNKSEETRYDGVPIIKPEEIVNFDIDKIFISVVDIKKIAEIKNQLHHLQIRDNKIEILTTSLPYMECYKDARIQWILEFSEFVKVEGMSGNVAECGVFRGDTAKFINKYFHDRKLYLFDTFTGFTEEDLLYEKELHNESFNNSEFASNPFVSNQDELQNFVLKKMTYPDNCSFKVGMFPDTANQVKDMFCFVNLDMDLYKPMLEGLHFFWDKMVKGGVILLHDYFMAELPGVRLAVKDFENEKGLSVTKVPIGDGCSLAIIK